MSITSNVEELRQAMLGPLLQDAAPKLPRLNAQEKRALRDDPAEFFSTIRPDLYEWAAWFISQPPWFAEKYAKGLGEQRKTVEMLTKHAFPQRLEIDVNDQRMRRLNDAEVIELARSVNALDDGQDVGSVWQVPEKTP